MNKKRLPLQALAYVLIFLSLQAAAQLGVQLVQYLRGVPAAQPDAAGSIAAMAIFSLAAIALFALTRWTPLSRHYVMQRPWGVLAWSAVAALGAIIPAAFTQELMPQWPDSIEQYMRQAEQLVSQMMHTRGGYAVICLLAPVAEEMVFRGAALRTLLRWQPRRRWLMILLSALLFALAHMNPAQFLHPLAIGLLLGWMYERTGSILPGVVYHWANNTAAYFIGIAFPQTDITLTDIFGQPSRVMMALAFSLLILLPAIYQLSLLMRHPYSKEKQ